MGRPLRFRRALRRVRARGRRAGTARAGGLPAVKLTEPIGVPSKLPGRAEEKLVAPIRPRMPVHPERVSRSPGTPGPDGRGVLVTRWSPASTGDRLDPPETRDRRGRARGVQPHRAAGPVGPRPAGPASSRGLPLPRGRVPKRHEPDQDRLLGPGVGPRGPDAVPRGRRGPGAALAAGRRGRRGPPPGVARHGRARVTAPRDASGRTRPRWPTSRRAPRPRRAARAG